MSTSTDQLPHTSQTAPTTNSPSDLMAKPALFWPEFWQDLLGIPDSTAEEIVRQPDGPRFFLIGRRRYIRTADAIEWINRAAAARPYHPRRNSRQRRGEQ